MSEPNKFHKVILEHYFWTRTCGFGMRNIKYSILLEVAQLGPINSSKVRLPDRLTRGAQMRIGYRELQTKCKSGKVYLN
jgi:hypothetical protein